MNTILQIQNLHVYFNTVEGIVRANRGVNLDVRQNEVMGIMGESGCGKTVLFLSLLRLQQPGKIVQGSILFDGIDLTHLKEKDMQPIRGNKIALIPQDHATALNPSYTIEKQLLEVLAIRENGGGYWQVWRGLRKMDRAQALAEIESVLEYLALGEAVHHDKLLKRYPHQLTGGIRQRILIAMALLANSRLIIADEPTTALDRATQMETLDFIKSLRGKATMLIISHDMDAIRETCDNVAIMYGGCIVERGPIGEVLENPKHPYSQLLISCQKLHRGQPLPAVSGDLQNLIDFPSGCSFHTNCPHAMAVCSEVQPQEHNIDGVTVSCHLFFKEGRND